VLVAAGALDAGTLAPRPLGEAARQLAGENELWLAAALSDPAVQARGGGNPKSYWRALRRSGRPRCRAESGRAARPGAGASQRARGRERGWPLCCQAPAVQACTGAPRRHGSLVWPGAAERLVRPRAPPGPAPASPGARARRARRRRRARPAAGLGLGYPAARSARARRAQTLRAPELAGVACALVAAEAVSKLHISAAYEPSAAVVAAVQALEPARSALFDLQADAGVHVPLGVDLRLAGARGVPLPPAPPARRARTCGGCAHAAPAERARRHAVSCRARAHHSLYTTGWDRRAHASGHRPAPETNMLELMNACPPASGLAPTERPLGPCMPARRAARRGGGVGGRRHLGAGHRRQQPGRRRRGAPAGPRGRPAPPGARCRGSLFVVLHRASVVIRHVLQRGSLLVVLRRRIRLSGMRCGAGLG